MRKLLFFSAKVLRNVSNILRFGSKKLRKMFVNGNPTTINNVKKKKDPGVCKKRYMV